MPTIFLAHAPPMLENYYGPRAVERLREAGAVRLNETGAALSTARLIEAARGCEIIVSDRNTPGAAALFDKAPELVAFLRCAVDVRTVDIDAASRNGVLVTNASPGFVDSVTELVLGMMVDLGRAVSAYALAYRRGEVPRARRGVQLAGSILGVIGYGAIGSRLAELAAALNMTVLVTDPHKQVEAPGLCQVELAALLEAADFVVCLAVATPETENLMDRAAFARMKPDAFFVNVSRGNLVDESALEAVLAEGRIAGAALDVGRAPDQMPSPGLAALPNVIATPHIGGLTPAAIEQQALETAEQALALAAGRLPHNALNPEQATRLARLGIAT